MTRRPVLASAPMARSLLVAGLSPEAREQASYPVDSPHWQTWANPEFMQHDIRLLLEFQDQHIRDLVLELVKASLSESGYELARTLMRINGVLGDIVGLPALMNDYSYNFALYGTPSHTEPWGWQLFGHHLAVNCSVAVTQMVITPIFFRAEPNTTGPSFPNAWLASSPATGGNRTPTVRKRGVPRLPGPRRSGHGGHKDRRQSQRRPLRRSCLQ